MKGKKLFLVCVLLAILTGFLSCSKDDDGGELSGELIIERYEEFNFVGAWIAYDAKVDKKRTYSCYVIKPNRTITHYFGRLNEDGYVEIESSDLNERESYTIDERGYYFTESGTEFHIKPAYNIGELRIINATYSGVSYFNRAKGIKIVD